MKKKISLIIQDAESRDKYLNLLVNDWHIPICKLCSKIFEFGFAESVEGMADHIICRENNLLCECPNSKIVRNLYKGKKDTPVDISAYYSSNI